MQPRVIRTSATLAATLTVAGLAAAAGAQQSYPRGQQQQQQQQPQQPHWQSGNDQYQRQQEMQRQSGRQQQQQWSQPGQFEGQQQFGGAPDVLLGFDLDNDGEADALYFVPSNVVQQIAQRHGQQQQFGRSMRMQQQQQQQAERQPQQLQQQWRQMQQAQMRGEPQFNDLPLADGGQMEMSRIQPTQLRGTVTDSRNVQLIGQSEPSKLVKVRTQDGATVFADLGPAQKVRNVQLSRGDQIALQGTPAWLNNQPVIFADRVQTQGGVIPIQREQQMQQWQQQQSQGRQQPQQNQQNQWQQSQGRQQPQQRQQDQWPQSQGRQQPQQQDQWQQRQQQEQLGQSGMSQPMRIRGTVKETNEVRIGDSDPYLFVHMQAEDGTSGWVSLGPVDQVQDLNISEDDQITVLAIPVQLQGETVYYARQLQARGETKNVSQKADQGQEPRFQQTGMGQMQNISGTIEKKNEVRIGDSDPYIFVKVSSDSGQTHWVNLGPKDQLKNLDLSEGDQISAMATETDIHGEQIFHAQQLKANGDTLRIQQAGYKPQ